MATRRAIVPLNDLRRWARVSREQGVSIRGSRASDGSMTVVVSPAGAAERSPDDDLDMRIERYVGK